MKYKISIILPVYNSGRKIKRTIDSILNQTYSEFELIIINDGSDDDSEKYILEYNDERIIYLKQQNSGVSVARNKGLQLSKGELVTFIDSDDYYEIDTMQILVDSFVDSIDTVVFGFRFEFNNHYEDETFCLGDKSIFNNLEIRNKIIPIMVKGSSFEGDLNGSVCRTIWKKSVIQNLFFNDKVAIEEDLMFCVEAYNLSNSICFLNRNLYHYVRNSGSATQQYRVSCLEEMIQVNDYLKQLLITIGLWNDEMKSRFSGKKIAMYTGCITNLFRDGAPHNKRQELKLIIDTFLQDNDIKIIDKKYVSTLRRVTVILMKMRATTIIIISYYFKELYRQARLNKRR